MTTTPNPTPEQADRVSMEVLEEYRKIAAWLESQAAVLGPVGDMMHGLAAEALTILIDHEYSRHTIPLYGMLDVWMAIHGTSHPEFDEFYAEHGYAETWAKLLDSVRRLRAAGVAPQEPSAHANPLATSGERVRNQTDSSHVAPQRPSEAIHEPSFNRVYCMRCGAKWPCQPAPSPDREKLIKQMQDELEYRVRTSVGKARLNYEKAFIDNQVADGRSRIAALAAQPMLDPETVTSKATAKNEHIDPERHGDYLADLLAEATVTWETAGRMPQVAMVHETQWKPFAALYNVTERLIDALSAQLTLDEGKVAEVVESSAAEWGDSDRVQAVLAQYIARALCEAAKRGELT